MKKLLLILLPLFLLFIIPSATAVPKEAANCQVSLVTIGPGEELYSIFGHSAILVRDTVRGEEKVYNYGTFDFYEPDFYSQFIHGDLTYYLSVVCSRCVENTTEHEGRSYVETPLNFTEQETSQLLEFLDWNARPENRDYTYDFQYDNCSSRILQIFLKHANASLNVPSSLYPKGTFRQMINPYLKDRPWVHVGIDFLLGSRVDREADFPQASFLPDDLHLILKNSRISRNGETTPLAGEDIKVLGSSIHHATAPITPTMVFWFVFILSVIALLISIFRSDRFLVIYGTVLMSLYGLLSLLLIFLWFGTKQDVFSFNTDLLWINPLLLPLVFIRKRNAPKWGKWLLLVTGLMVMAGVFTTWLVEGNTDLTALALALSVFMGFLIWKNRGMKIFKKAGIQSSSN